LRETIELGEGDSVAVARRKLEEATIPQVALLIPPSNPLLQSEVKLNLIRRFAEALALDLVLVTGDRATVGRARRAGLRTVSTLPAAQRLHSVRATRALQPALVRGQAERLLPPGRSAAGGRSSLWAEVALILLVTVMLTVMGAGAALILPEAVVTLDPVGEAASVNTELTASTQWAEANDALRQVPARLTDLTVQGEESGQTTGRQTVDDGHATGDVVLANKTTEEVTVPKGTVVSTNDGIPIKFYTLLDAKVPGSYGATVRVPVMAFDPGVQGNVPALTIRVVEGEPSLQVEVLNDQPLQGGTQKRVAIVSEDDMNRLRSSLIQRVQQEAYDKLVTNLQEGEWIPPDSLDIQVIAETFDKQLNEQADMLHLTMTVRVVGLAVDGNAARALLVRLLEAGQTKGLVVNEATLQVQQPVGSAAVSGQTVQFKASASAFLVPAIDPRAVSRGIAGLDTAHARAWLSDHYALRRPPSIELQPSWWPRLPWVAWRIRTQLAGGM